MTTVVVLFAGASGVDFLLLTLVAERPLLGALLAVVCVSVVCCVLCSCGGRSVDSFSFHFTPLTFTTFTQQ